ncbi:ATP-dependent Clp protease ATP-binding subunit ClpA [Chitinivorax tropicus]|uniref:ATP-dependent Clp protease ATP-binding subunit ClpA n=1 Tax=Chitinivorax tropicus TaxID=714531 RepID=A0A840MKZ4_9PROT|nr:Clp protease N-terminal domain-containing protein [Chitinivorax tropicus]MBB5019834.1 ATP-dependent Clp protease ATP-binding subunit ClpA [Chitinivorax tropicus]
MFQRVRNYLAKAKQLKQLCEAAERYAHADAKSEVGAEHFVLAALDMSDGTASLALQVCGVDASQFRTALAQQYDVALRDVGMGGNKVRPIEAIGIATDVNRPTANPPRGIFRGAASAQALMQALHRLGNDALLSANVLNAAAQAERGIVARTLAVLGIERKALIQAAQEAALSNA